MAIMLKSLREERQQTYSIFLPIHPETGRVLYVPMKHVDAQDHTITFDDDTADFTTTMETCEDGEIQDGKICSDGEWIDAPEDPNDPGQEDSTDGDSGSQTNLYVQELQDGETLNEAFGTLSGQTYMLSAYRAITQESQSIVNQTLSFPATYPAIYTGENEDGEQGTYLHAKAGQNLFTYTASFEPAMTSDVNAGQAEDYLDEDLSILGDEYRIMDARVTDNRLELSLMSGQIRDALEQGQTRTYTVDGKEYEVRVLAVSSTAPHDVKFEVNGEITDALQAGEQDTLSDGMQIAVEQAIYSEQTTTSDPGSIVEFYLGSSAVDLQANAQGGDVIIDGELIEDASVQIDYDQTQYRVHINSITYSVQADAAVGADIYVPVGSSLREHIDDPKALLGMASGASAWDIYYESSADGLHKIAIGKKSSSYANIKTYETARLELAQSLGSEIGTLHHGIFFLQDYTLLSSRYGQALSFTDTGLYVFAGENENNEPGTYLYTPEVQIINYTMAFEPALTTAIENQQATALHGESVFMLGEEYTIFDTFFGTQFLELSLIEAGLEDTLALGQTETYNVDGTDYEVTLQQINATSPQRATFLINQEPTQPLQEREHQQMSSGLHIAVQEVGQQDNPYARFHLGADVVQITGGAQGGGDLTVSGERIEDVYAGIRYTRDENTLLLSEIALDLRADSSTGTEIYMEPGTSLREYLDEPQGMLGQWDVHYAGEKNQQHIVYIGDHYPSETYFAKDYLLSVQNDEVQHYTRHDEPQVDFLNYQQSYQIQFDSSTVQVHIHEATAQELYDTYLPLIEADTASQVTQDPDELKISWTQGDYQLVVWFTDKGEAFIAEDPVDQHPSQVMQAYLETYAPAARTGGGAGGGGSGGDPISFVVDLSGAQLVSDQTNITPDEAYGVRHEVKYELTGGEELTVRAYRYDSGTIAENLETHLSGWGQFGVRMDRTQYNGSVVGNGDSIYGSIFVPRQDYVVTTSRSVIGDYPALEAAEQEYIDALGIVRRAAEDQIVLSNFPSLIADGQDVQIVTANDQGAEAQAFTEQLIQALANTDGVGAIQPMPASDLTALRGKHTIFVGTICNNPALADYRDNPPDCTEMYLGQARTAISEQGFGDMKVVYESNSFTTELSLLLPSQELPFAVFDGSGDNTERCVANMAGGGVVLRTDCDTLAQEPMVYKSPPTGFTVAESNWGTQPGDLAAEGFEGRVYERYEQDTATIELAVGFYSGINKSTEDVLLDVTVNQFPSTDWLRYNGEDILYANLNGDRTYAWVTRDDRVAIVWGNSASNITSIEEVVQDLQMALPPAPISYSGELQDPDYDPISDPVQECDPDAGNCFAVA